MNKRSGVEWFVSALHAYREKDKTRVRCEVLHVTNHTHQADVQLRLSGPEIAAAGLMQVSTESEQERRVFCTMHGFQDRDTCGSSTSKDHLLGYRTQNSPLLPPPLPPSPPKKKEACNETDERSKQ